MRIEKRKRPGEPSSGVKIKVCTLFLDRKNALPIPRNDGEKNAAYLDRLESMVAHLLGCEPKDINYDHNPALRIRKYKPRQGKPIASWYTPHANDPEYLYPIAYPDHVHKTQLRGHGAQHSDRVLIKKLRRIERLEAEKKTKTKVSRKIKTPFQRALPFAQKIKVKIPSRGFPKGRKVQWGR